MVSREQFSRDITEAADLGISLVGPHKALAAALRAQHTMVAEFFSLVKGVMVKADAGEMPPALPLQGDVITLYNNAVGSMALVAELMKRDVLGIHRDTEDSQPTKSEDNIIQFPHGGGTRH